jgi:predicted RNase H-like HicB family nuclease
MASYYALIYQHADGFALVFPDLPGCDVYALTMPDAVAEASNALAQRLAEISRSGALAPAPSSLDAIRQDPSNEDSLAVLVHA